MTNELFKEQAFTFLQSYMKSNRRFQVEDVREASMGIIAQPRDKRAWGSVIKKAQRLGLVKNVGYESVSNPKANGTPASVWVRQGNFFNNLFDNINVFKR